jgi:DNA-binding transcriptional LysR family regulator
MVDDEVPIRVGYHGSRPLIEGLLGAARVSSESVEWSAYDVADPFRSVRAGDLDAMVVKFSLREPDLVTGPVLGYDGRAAVLAHHHDLAGCASVSIEDLARYPAFERPGSMPAYVWDEVVPRRTPHGLVIRRRHRAASLTEMMSAVRGGAVHLSLRSLADVTPPDVVVVPIHDLPPAPVALAWRRHPAPRATARSFLDAMRSEAHS